MKDFFAVAVFGALVAGWFANAYKMIVAIGDPLTGLMALRIIGFFAPPLGGIVGYF